MCFYNEKQQNRSRTASIKHKRQKVRRKKQHTIRGKYTFRETFCLANYAIYLWLNNLIVSFGKLLFFMKNFVVSFWSIQKKVLPL